MKLKQQETFVHVENACINLDVRTVNTNSVVINYDNIMILHCIVGIEQYLHYFSTCQCNIGIILLRIMFINSVKKNLQ